ncbi:hypothetical protein R1sor_010209 [Riccia sorocarpa]|uniref:Myb/SANT-like DNA-binding domain-containing protein n=1 Tax=Riccia sorocarpa TaxID=122646 RepID=A0ABD3HXF9_9MARC
MEDTAELPASEQEQELLSCSLEDISYRDLIINSIEVKTPGQGAAEWTDTAVGTFLDCFAEKYSTVKHKNLRGKDWMEVVDGLNKRCAPKGGPFFEYKQCRNKLDGLKKRFRQEKDSMSASSQPSRWQWYDRMLDLKWARNMKLIENHDGREDRLETCEGQVDCLVPDEPIIDAPDRCGEVSMQEEAWAKCHMPSGSPKQKHKRRRVYVFNPNVSEIVAENLRPLAELLPPCTPDNISAVPERPLMKQSQDMSPTDRTFKLRIRRPNEPECDDLFHFTGETVSDMIESFKSVYWEDATTQVRVQLKEKFTDIWVTVAPSVSLSQYGSEAVIVTRPRGVCLPLTSAMAAAQG